MGRKLVDTELELYRRVDEILYYVWDPIGVAYSPAARNEYQGYLPKVFAMLQEDGSASSIAAYLDTVATERMGLDARGEHSKRVAELLLDCRTEIYRKRDILIVCNPRLRETFLAFREQCIWLQTCYNTYAALFESDQPTKEILSRTAQTFFDELNIIFIEYCLLQVCKLTDPSNSKGRDNLTFKHLNGLLGAKNLLTPEIIAASNGLESYRNLIKDGRNRIISHADKETLLADLVLGAHEESDVHAFFENLHKYVDAVGIAVGVGPLDFRTTAGPGDALDLLRYLRVGLNHRTGVE